MKTIEVEIEKMRKMAEEAEKMAEELAQVAEEMTAAADALESAQADALEAKERLDALKAQSAA